MGRAMIREPKVFLFDEPLSNLDAQLRVQMRAEIRRLHRRLGTTSVFVTHDQVEAMTLADRLVVMRAGRIEQVGTPAEIYGRPASRFVAGFIGSPPMNLVDGTVDGDGAFVAGGAPATAFPLGMRRSLAGQRVTLGVRPEAVRLMSPTAQGSVAAAVEFVEELGAGRVVHAELAGRSFAVATAEPVTLSPGEPIGIAIDLGAAHFFAGDEGLRLDDATVSRQAAAA